MNLSRKQKQVHSTENKLVVAKGEEGVGMDWEFGVSVTQLCLTLCDPMDCSPPSSSVRGIFPGKNMGVGCHFLLQGIFLTQGLNLDLLHCMQILYCLNHPILSI